MTDSFSDALDREWQLAKGFGRGVAEAPAKVWDSWGYSLALALGTGVAAYGLGAFGKLASPALSAVVAPTLARIGMAFNVGMATDAATWLYRAGATATDTWNNPSHLGHDIGRAESLGTEAAGTAALLGTGLAGFKLAAWKTPFYTAANFDSVFGKLRPGEAPRMQVHDWWGRRPSIEPANSELAQFYHDKSQAVGHLVTESSNTATAFYAHKDGLWLTNYHAIEGNGPLVIHYNGRGLEAKIAAVDPRADVAVLVTNPLEGVEPVKLAASGGDIYSTKPSVIISHSDNVETPTITTTDSFRYPAFPKEGTSEFLPVDEPATVKDGHAENGSFLMTRDVLMGGSSGSPVFDRHTKEVLGMVTGRFGTNGTGISAEHLSPLLGEAAADLELGDNGKVLKLSTALKTPPNESYTAALERPVEITNREIINEQDILHAQEKLYPPPPAAPEAELGSLRASTGIAASEHVAKQAYDQLRG